jgi:hypothetical protein
MESSPYFVIPKNHNLDVQQFICYTIVISSDAFGPGIMEKQIIPNIAVQRGKFRGLYFQFIERNR